MLVLPLCLLVLRDSPESVGLTPDGIPLKPGTTAPPVERVTAGEALQTLAFWQLAGSFFTCGFSMSLLSAHGIPMLTDHGYTPMFASWAMGVLGGSSIGFTVMLGALSDRFGRRPVLATIYAGRILIFAGLFLIRDNPMAILAVAVFGGITLAGTGSMTSALTADIYGRFSVSSVFGLIFLVHQTGSALGSSLAGLLFERDRRLRRGLRDGLRVPAGRRDRRPQHRQGRAPDLARRHRLGDLAKSGAPIWPPHPTLRAPGNPWRSANVVVRFGTPIGAPRRSRPLLAAGVDLLHLLLGPGDRLVGGHLASRVLREHVREDVEVPHLL